MVDGPVTTAAPHLPPATGPVLAPGVVRPAAQPAATAEPATAASISREVNRRLPGRTNSTSVMSVGLTAAMSDGRVTREEFNRATGLDFTEEGWTALLRADSDGAITSFDDLNHVLTVAWSAADSSAGSFVGVTQQGRRDSGAVAGHLFLAMQDGRLTHDEFKTATGYRDLTEAAWNAFIGGSQGGNQPEVGGNHAVTDLRHLSGYFRQYNLFQQMTGTSFDQFARWRNISIVSQQVLLERMISLNEAQLRQLVSRMGDKNRIISLMRQVGISVPDILPGSNYEEMQAGAIIIGIQRMQVWAAGGEGVSAEQQLRGRHMLSLLGVMLLGQMNDTIEDNIDSDGLAETNYGLTDPLVSRHFMHTIFTETISGQPLTADQMERVEQYAEQITSLRALVGPGVALDQIDTRTPQFAGVLELVGQGRPAAEVRAALAECPQMGSLTSLLSQDTHAAIARHGMTDERAVPASLALEVRPIVTPVTPPTAEPAEEAPANPTETTDDTSPVVPAPAYGFSSFPRPGRVVSVPR